MGVQVKKEDRIVLWYPDATLRTIGTYIRNGHPELTADLDAGRLVFEFAEEDSLSPPPAGPTPEEVVAENEQAVRHLVLEAAGRLLLDHENRLRALEEKPAVTRDQFKQVIKALP